MDSRISRLLAVALVAGLCGASALGADEPAAASTGRKININQASASQLVLLPRVGAKAAERIVEYRKAHGSFNQADELMEVKGIGEKLFLQLKPYIALSGPTSLASKVSSRGTRGATAGKKSASNTVPVGKGR